MGGVSSLGLLCLTHLLCLFAVALFGLVMRYVNDLVGGKCSLGATLAPIADVTIIVNFLRDTTVHS